jgi:hypothetical protein
MDGSSKKGIIMDDKLGYALLLAAFGLVGKYFFDWLAARNHAIAFQQAILAEIYALLNLIEVRNYRKFLEDGIFGSSLNSLTDTPYLLSMNIQDNYCPVYYNNLDKIQLLNKNIAKDVVLFYALIASLVQDLKPEGVFNNKVHSSVEAYKAGLTILDMAIKTGEKLISIQYRKELNNNGNSSIK